MNSKRVGTGFENVFEKITAQAGILCIRIPDGCKVVGLNNLVRKKTPFDFILISNGQCAMIDTKTTIGESFRINDPKLFEPHQISIMKAANERGITAGFMILFRLTETLCFIEAKDLDNLKYQGKKSIGPSDCILLGRLGEELNWKVLFD